MDLTWEERGYWGGLKPDNLADDGDEWKAWAIALDQAKQGEFAPLISVLNIAWKTFDSVLEHISYELIGDAAPDEVFEPMVDYIQSTRCQSCFVLYFRPDRSNGGPKPQRVYTNMSEYKKVVMAALLVANSIPS